ncbi:hypothetical protein FSP39_000729 [Pinctada imbricata]|uniref:SERTA domain-containing protein n=1 Tax=Pinctada imbricata TaxID=66713 RepID=A0AA88Y4A4_PINIB|nr:hypothetical protein FSP39_000729 [Pinctada imbricata]
MGVKRKVDVLEEAENYGGQRQSVLNISMCKLQTHSVKKVEPSLLKSVLILNTLKHIETELKKEGVCSCFPESTTFSLQDNTDDLSMDVLPENLDGGEYIEQDFSDLNLDKEKMKQCDVEPVVPVKEPVYSPLPPIESFVELSNAVGMTTPFSQDSNSPSLSVKLSSSSESLPCRNSFIASKEKCSPVFTHQTSLPLKVEDLIGEVDLSHCDLDFFSSLTSSMKLTPLSADEVLHSFPGHPGAIVDNLPSFIASSINSTCKGEVLPDEIDNIMQVLVGT